MVIQQFCMLHCAHWNVLSSLIQPRSRVCHCGHTWDVTLDSWVSLFTFVLTQKRPNPALTQFTYSASVPWAGYTSETEHPPMVTVCKLRIYYDLESQVGPEHSLAILIIFFFPLPFFHDPRRLFILPTPLKSLTSFTVFHGWFWFLLHRK